MNFDMIGLHPDSAMNIVLKLYDSKASENEKVKLLLENRAVEKLNSVDLPPNFSSGITIDINAGELLSLGAVVSYFNWIGSMGDGDSYQVGVGIEDSVKAQTENLLSDGTIWHNQSAEKMVVQQVMVQGYFPNKVIRSSDIVKQIKHKANMRDRYPDNCALIVSIFSESGDYDFNIIRKEAGLEIAKFNDVYLVTYALPSLDRAAVFYINDQRAPNLTIQLKRHPMDEEWRFNYDAKRGLVAQSTG